MPTRYAGLFRVFVMIGLGACLWALLCPVIVLLPVFQAPLSAPGVAAATGQNAMHAGRLGEALTALAPGAAAGAAGLAGIILVAEGAAWGRTLIAGAALVLLLLTILTAASIGEAFFPPGIVLALATLWLPSPPPRES